MTMQYDVKSYHNTASGVAVPYRTRLKGVVISPVSSTTYNVAIANNVSQSGTYNIPGTTTCTVTIAGHGVVLGSRDGYSLLLVVPLAIRTWLQQLHKILLQLQLER